MEARAARILIGGTGSGCGKTTAASAILRAWQREGVSLAAFKCGPDYIDPMFHKEVLEVPSRNLDLFFSDGRTVRATLAKNIPEEGIGVIEGAMGFYDGVSGTTDEASSAHLARVLEAPAVLVMRPKGQSLSLAAELEGFKNFMPNTISGVILNGVTKGMYRFYRKIVERTGLSVYGYMPSVPECEIPCRHLGLVTAGEIKGLRKKLDLLADAAEECLDLEGLRRLAETAPGISDGLLPLSRVCGERVRVAVAMDEAFCFYYEDNLDVLGELGAELVRFSILSGGRLPDDVSGLYIGGGYPELYGERLAGNVSMRDSVREAVRGGMPTIAECGGFQYLHKSLDGYPMAGAFPFEARMTDKLQRFGYVTLTAERDNLLCGKGGSIRAHEFHYGLSDDMGDAFEERKPNGRTWLGVHATETLYAGYPHLYFRNNPEFAESFVRKCLKYREER